MNDFNDMNSMGNGSGELAERNEASSNIFLDMNETDSTGIPSLKQAPVSAISSSASSSKINTQIVIAGLVLAIGAGAIYGMRHIGMQAGLDEQIVSIDYTADANNAEFSKRFTAVMGMLDKSSLAVQLTDDESFADTPFSRIVEEEVEEYEPIDPGMSEEEQMAIRRQREMEQEVQRRQDMVISEALRFTLQGVIGGSRPAARVSGIPVRVGMDLGEFFTVAEITGRSVIIEADGMRFELVMGEETMRLD